MSTAVPDKLAEAKAKLEEADTLLAEWLTDNTEEVFEEQPEVDAARGLAQDAVELLEEAKNNGLKEYTK